MKYPQLVSARAVNAISDWLVSRLERLGIDAPQVYSRLLLSLLHTPLQLNALDLAEVTKQQTQSKGCLGRKNGRRLTPSEAESLKRFAAVESLMDAAASDENKTEIEDLVDELCEKLREIEKQNNLEGGEIELLKASPQNNNNTTNQKNTQSTDSPAEDPTKRYYRAFPPLSKELGDKSSGTLKPIQMPLMWPSNQTSLTTANNTVNINNIKFSGSNSILTNNSNTAGVKRKTKRRRNNNTNQGLMKSYNATLKNKGESSSLDKSSALWDTNFEGTWEMGHDLIREFILKQNKRNRSISENDAYNQSDLMSHHDHDVDDENANYSTNSENPSLTINDNQTNLNVCPVFGNTTITDEGFATPDTFTSFCELSDIASSSSRNQNLLNPRRLYEREPSNELIADDDNNNIALFEAKFNSSVEALWDDKETSKSSITNEPNKKSDLNMFWSNYYKHHYKPQDQSENNNNTNTFDQYRNNSIDLFTGLLDTSGASSLSASNQSYNNKKNMFIESGTNLQSSIWSNNPEPNDDIDTALCSRELWDEIASNNKNENIVAPSDGSCSIDNLINFSKWSDCSCEAPFVPAQTSQNKNNEFGNQTVGYKSLPIMYTSNISYNNRKLESDNNDSKLKCNQTDGIKTTKSNAIEQKKAVKITLNNHSENSGFRKVYPKTINYYDYYDRQYKNGLEASKRRYNQEHVMSEDENLLISERTHFRPIKQTYVDGYTFDIPCHLDDIKYQRSESGSLYFESEKYMEYKNIDRVYSRDGVKRTYNDNFTLKFCVKQNEKYCQTDDEILLYDNNIDDGFIKSYYRSSSKYLFENDDEIDDNCCGDIDDLDMACQREQARILNYCVCYEQKYNKALEECEEDDDIISIHQHYEHRKRNDSNTTNLSDRICSVHPMMNTELENWSLNNIKTKCLNNNHSHTLWGHCATCKNDVESLPANHLMKAELSADGDEIMSDLKYMQNLFIGADWEDEQIVEQDEINNNDRVDNDDEDDDDDEDNDVDDDEEDHNISCEFIFEENHCLDDIDFKQNYHFNLDDDDDLINDNDEKCSNVNKLISDLLKPETAKSISQILGPSQSKSILQEIAMNEKSQKSNDWYNFKQLQPETSSLCSGNNNNIYMSGDGVFGLWKKYDSGDWENCKNLKSIIENQSEDQEHVDDLLKGQKKHFEIITLWNNDNHHHTHFPDFIFQENEFEHLDHHHNDGLGNLTMANNSFINFNNNNNNEKLGCVKRSDRKRRHSSSQNYNDDILSSHGKFLINANDKFDVTATVITCKYWAKDSRFFPNFEGDLEVTPSSILKHVAMVSRPLTR